tara:strand:+ start:3525 stop:4112 length:588 start_codon:yes stop_codon:yes gene_type:complete
MNEIFLQDYANNVAQAQDPYGIAAVQAQPGFENYIPSFQNQSLAPMGLAPDTGQIPDVKKVLGEVAINSAKNYAIKKMGLDGIKGNILSSVLGSNPYFQGIATLGSALTGNSLNTSRMLAEKRAKKSYDRNQTIMQNALNKSQIVAIQNKLASQPVSNQDQGRGQTTSAASPATSAPAPRQERQTAGSGGLHSGY